MTLRWLDHVNIRTARLAELAGFYRDVLGLEPGPRPPFDVPGVWLYCGSRAAVHLVEVTRAPVGTEPRLEHFAFMATGLAPFLARLRARGVAYETAVVPGSGNRQVHLRDPDGNHVEIQFEAGEPVEIAEPPPPSSASRAGRR